MLPRVLPGRESLKRCMTAAWDESERDYRALLLDSLPAGPVGSLLDVGCDDGAWTAAVAERLGVPPDGVHAVEVVDERRALAEARGFHVVAADLDVPWPFPDDAFEVVHANQVIEHVRRLDHFVGEVRRVLAPEGRAVICTENLASWHNVGALVLGYMPFSLTNISREGRVGNPLAIHADDETGTPDSWQHTHVLTLRGLTSIFELHGFEVERTFAAGYHPARGRLARRLAGADPRHAHFIGLVARLPGPTPPGSPGR
jgi:SAM-dependent methyltransferase